MVVFCGLCVFGCFCVCFCVWSFFWVCFLDVFFVVCLFCWLLLGVEVVPLNKEKGFCYGFVVFFVGFCLVGFVAFGRKVVPKEKIPRATKKHLTIKN